MAWCGTPRAAAELWLQWNTHPVQAVLLLALLAGAAMAEPGRRRHLLAFWAALVVAFVSPLCALTVSLFSARVVHHLLLVLVAAPLLALAFPARRALGLTAASAGLVIAMWAWHWPPAYLAAYDSVLAYWAMQVSLLGAAGLFWRAALAREAETLPVLVSLAAVSGAMGLLGALLTFAPRPLYAPHLLTTWNFGLAPLQDQQLGGLLMWVPGMLPFAIAGILLARGRFRALARDAAS